MRPEDALGAYIEGVRREEARFEEAQSAVDRLVNGDRTPSSTSAGLRTAWTASIEEVCDDGSIEETKIDAMRL